MATYHRHFSFQAFLHCLAFALLALGGISLIAFAIPTNPARHELVLLPDTALLTLLAGTALLSATHGLRRLPLLTGLALIVFAGYSLGHNVLAGGSDHGRSLISSYWRIRSELAIVGGLFGLAVILAATRQGGRWLSQLCGISLIGLALMSELSLQGAGHSLPRFAFYPESGHIANFFTALLGGAVLILCALPDEHRRLLDRRTLITGMLGALATCVGGFLLSQNEVTTLNTHSHQLLLRAQSSIENTLTVRLQLMQRMAERWQNLRGLPPDALWQQEAHSYLRDFPNINLIALLDADLKPIQQLGRNRQAGDWLARFLAQAELRDWLLAVRLGQGAQMSAAQSFAAEDNSTLVATPLRIDGRPAALLVASLDIGATLDRQLGRDLDGFVLEVFEGPKRIYASAMGSEGHSLFPVGVQRANLGPEGRWTLRTYQALPRSDYAAVYLPPLFMLFGLGFTFLLMVSQRFARLAIERSQNLRESNRELELSLQHQARLQVQNQRIMDYSMDVLCSIDEAERFTQVSPSCHSVLGYRPEEMIGHPYTDFVLAEDRERTRGDVQAIIRGDSWDAVRNRCQRKDGSVVHLLWSAGWSEGERTLFAVAHDITSLVRHEAYAEDQRDILSMISTDQPLQDILKAICQMSETLEPTALCSVLLVDGDRKHLHLGAAPSLPEAYGQTLDGLPIGPLSGTCGTAVFRRQMVISEDISEDPLWHEHREQALRHGLRACWAIPLISHHGDVLGTFAVHLRHPCAPDDEALQLIGTAGQLAAIAIERQNDHLRLQVSEQRYRSLFTFNPDPVFSFDPEGRFVSLNQAGCELIGYSAPELPGQSFTSLVQAEDVERLRRHFRTVLQGTAQRYELRCRNRAGQVLELDITNLPIVVEGQIVGVFGIAKDIGERNRMTRTLQETLTQSERKAQLLHGLSDTALRIGGILDTHALLDFMCEQLRQLVGAHQALFNLADDQRLDAFSLSTKYQAWQAPQLPAEGLALYARASAGNQPFLLTRAELEAPGDSATGQLPLQGWLAVPLIDHGGRHLGLIQLSDKFDGDFNQDDLAIAQQFARMAVAALENIRLVQQVLSGEQRLQEQLDFTSAITDSVGEGLLAVDRQGRLTFVNPAGAGLLGQSADALLGQALADHLPLDLYSAPATGSRHGEVSLDGERHVAYDCAPLLHARTLGGWVIAFRDISRAKESEKQLRILQRSIEASYNGALICDATADDLPIIYVNPAFERITGYSAGEALGRNCRFLQGADREQAGIAEIRHSLAEKREVHVVLRNFRKDGTPFWNDLYIAPVPNEHGEITHFIGVQNDISEQKRVESELAYNASHDVLTGLPNRSLLEDRLRQGCQISQRYQRKLAVMFIDLDGFKPINDSMGHGIGDQILVEVARRLSQQVRPGDTVARLGGDEFILILPDLAREEDVLQVAERVIDCIARPYPIAGSELHITASLGIAMSEKGMQQPMQLIQQADLAMYKAKQQGRNCYQWYTTDLEQKVSERVTLRNELQKALEASAFMLYYQPQIDGRNGRVTGYEALLRWQHPLLGFISPSQFVPVAEDTGQIIPLSEWVLATACRDCRELLDRGMGSTVVAVNISAVHFQRNIFVDSVRRVLEETRLPAEMLELEITETVLLDNAERAIATLQALKALGVRLSIDDFGTGFSSLNYLKRLPIDKVKIDRAFVQEIISDHHDAAITQGIISMAHHLRLRVIAEGVETEPQFAFLKKSHCDEFQGYYFARPMPFKQLEQFLHEHHKSPAAYLETRSGTSNTQTLLLLDDEENILRALTRVLRRDGYQILTASRAQDAFAQLAKHDIQVILSDQRMPEMNGTEFLSRVKDLYPDTIRIVLSGYTDLKSVTDAINQGAIYKFLTKPWDDEQLRAVIAQAFLHHSLAKAKEENATVEEDEE
ncbi:EAL domain-containing protein [Pseudomonas sp. TCU-HL1]|uniref:EAL domain-containing protein n=1 Tax=Pseudomonas sp. TCU-HL1 TaxID=1856685 RepID=UPI00083E602D|nr:EAL domain-containing protein [Pseudomonas sp. TCU-HL1]AOE86379.1 diguanylate cyclase [Pseudomonas sp. TCU-HL1]